MTQKKPRRRKRLSKDEILSVFLNFVKKNKRTPSKTDLVTAGRKRVTISMVQTHFGSLTKLEEYARKEHPEVFEGVVDEALFTKKNFRRLQQEVGKFTRFVITTAVTGCTIHEKFLKSIKTYCKKNKALLLVIPVSDPAHHFGSRGAKKWPLDSNLAGEYLVFDDLSLNDNLNIRTIKTSAKQIDPVTGLARLGQRDGSFIYGSPKQRLKFIPVGETKFPHAMMTTGAVTTPNYSTENYFSLRTAAIAEHDHVLGALVVEIDSEDIFHFRQLQAEPRSGKFVDLGNYYGPDSVDRLEADTFVLGDYHAGEHDLTAKEAWKEVIKYTGVKNLVIHDLFNGKSISHHERNKTITRARQTEEDLVSLESEIKVATIELNELCTWVKGNIIITKSNHDEWLERYLQDGVYIRESQNLWFASQLIAPFIEGEDPLKFAMEELAGLEYVEPKVKWLAREDSHKVFGIECGAHGDKGSSGSRGSMKNIELAYGKCVIGHVHTPEILRDVWRVGTTSILDPDYIKGSPSGWFHTSCLIYPNGSRQLINSIQGKWRKK